MAHLLFEQKSLALGKSHSLHTHMNQTDRQFVHNRHSSAVKRLGLICVTQSGLQLLFVDVVHTQRVWVLNRKDSLDFTNGRLVGSLVDGSLDMVASWSRQTIDSLTCQVLTKLLRTMT